VAKIGNRTVSYAQFLDARDTLKVYFASSAAIQAGMTGPITTEIEKNAFDRIVRETEDQELAGQRHVSVTEDDVKKSFDELIASTSSTVPDVDKYLKETFNWNQSQFKDKVVRPAMLEQAIATSFSTSTDEQSALYEAYLTQRLTQPDVKIYLKF
jgi:hypothetical protein